MALDVLDDEPRPVASGVQHDQQRRRRLLRQVADGVRAVDRVARGLAGLDHLAAAAGRHLEFATQHAQVLAGARLMRADSSAPPGCMGQFVPLEVAGQVDGTEAPQPARRLAVGAGQPGRPVRRDDLDRRRGGSFRRLETGQLHPQRMASRHTTASRGIGLVALDLREH